MGKKRKRKQKKSTYEKIVKIPIGVIDQIQKDIKGNSLIFYQCDQVPPVFIHKNLIHPEMFKKCIGVAAALSACCADNRNYMYLGGMRIDKARGENVTDFDL